MSEKRAAPISASAYAFSLSTPNNKKIKSEVGRGGTPASASRSKPVWSPGLKQPKLEPVTPRQGQASSEQQGIKPEPTAREATPLRSVTAADVKPVIPADTPRRLTDVFRPLGSLTTPVGHTIKSGEPGSSSSKVLRRINAAITQVDVKPKQEPVNDKPRVTLGETLIDEKTADDLLSRTRKAQLAEEDEGIGVSPRGKRIAKWSGRSAPPPSVQLANLLSSSNASLHLFYTSMQHVLRPAHSAFTRSRPKGNMTNHPSINAGITSFQHIQHSAPVRLRIVSPLVGPAHHSTLFLAEPLKWPDPTPPRKVIIAFQPLPSECPKLGVDPKLLSLRMENERGKTWQAGLWLWTEVELPSHPDLAVGSSNGQEDGRVESGPQSDTIVLLATRYLVAEQPF
ncbi:hypothetical protein IAU60_001127 [Kwoniella sp. DSM 27419]